MKFDQELRIFFPQVKILSGIILLECSLKSQKKGAKQTHHLLVANLKQAETPRLGSNV